MKVFRILLVAALALQAEALAAQVQGIRTSSSATKVRIVLDCDGPVAYKDTSAGLRYSWNWQGEAKAQPASSCRPGLQKMQLVQDGKDKSSLLVNLQTGPAPGPGFKKSGPDRPGCLPDCHYQAAR
jgi:hypothetical protein